MKIETRYSIGDEVWRAEYIAVISANSSQEGYQPVSYIVGEKWGDLKEDPDVYFLEGYGFCPKERVFLTQEDAQAECDELNGGKDG